MKRKCSHPECDQPCIARGLCTKHYQRAKVSGSLPPRVLQIPEGTCVAIDCDLDAEIRGYCKKHYLRFKRHGDPSVRKRRANGEGTGPCSAEGCSNSANSRGLCTLHYHRSRAKPRKRPIITTCTVDGCLRPHDGLGLCGMHRGRLKRVGEIGPAGSKITERGAQVQWLRDHKSYDGADCLIWPFPRNADGYGHVTFNGKHRSAQSVMCEMAHGPAGFARPDAAHSCGNGHLGCLHPKHLRWATRQENCDDTVAHGRTTRGEKNRHAKLTDTQVIAIIEDKRSNAETALAFGVSRATVRRSRAGETWKHIASSRAA